MTFDAGTWWLAVLLLGFVTAGLVYLLKRSLFGRIDKLDESMKEISENSVKKSDYHRLDMFPPGDPLRLGCSHGDPRLYAMAGKESV